LSLKHAAEGGSIAEEVISTVRTAQAFGTQKRLGALYDDHVNESLKVDLKAAIWQGSGTALFFFIIYSAYGLGMFKSVFLQCLILTRFQQLSALVPHLSIVDRVSSGPQSTIVNSMIDSIYSKCWSRCQRVFGHFDWFFFPCPSRS